MKRIVFILFGILIFCIACAPILSQRAKVDQFDAVDGAQNEESSSQGFSENKFFLSDVDRIDEAPMGNQQNIAVKPAVNTEMNYDKKVYFGFLALLVKDVDAIRNEIIALTNANGGLVESFSMNTVVIRVPKVKFGDVFERIENMGKLKNKSIQTYDVSESYEDYSLRLSIATETRSRLYYLLELTKDVKERLNILKEIQRLTEDIERIQQYLQSLDSMIQYSKISITLESIISPITGKTYQDIPFQWIAGIEPFGANNQKINGTIKINLPDNYAVLEKKKNYFAVNPFGSNLLVYSVTNKPKGDSEFWRKALAYHLSPFYDECKNLDLGAIKGVILKSPDQDPFYLFVGVYAVKDRIFVIKALFPTQEQYDAEKEKISMTIKTMELKR